MQWCVQMLMEQFDFSSSWETLAQHHLLGGFCLIKLFWQLLVLLQVPGCAWILLKLSPTSHKLQLFALQSYNWRPSVQQVINNSTGELGGSCATPQGGFVSWGWWEEQSRSQQLLEPSSHFGARCPLLTSHKDVNPAECWKGWVSLYSYKSSFG